MTPSRKRRNHCSPRATTGSSVSPSRNTAHDYHHLRITHFNSSHHSNHLVAVKLPESTLETLSWVLRRPLSVPLPLLASAHRRSQSQGPINTTTLRQVQPSSRNESSSKLSTFPITRSSHHYKHQASCQDFRLYG